MKNSTLITERKNKYYVMLNGNKIGTLIWSDPISWDKYRCEYHKNDGTWCTNNALEDITWLNDKISKSLIKEIERLDDELCCACGLLEFKWGE